MDVLCHCKLHARYGNYSVLFCRREEGGAVFARIVVGQRHDLKTRKHTHSDNVAGGAVVIRAR